jgi:hypothetical protein
MGVGSYVKFPDMWRQVLRERGASLADWKIAIELLAMALRRGGEIDQSQGG